MILKPLSIIVAVDIRGGFGKKGKIPWINEPIAKQDFKRFQKITKNNVCIMGRRTYEEIIERALSRRKKIKTLLPNRESYVLSRDPNFKPEAEAIVKSGLRQARQSIEDNEKEIFILGGDKIFIESLADVNKIYMTVIKKEYDCDRHLPVEYIDKHFNIVTGEETKKAYFVEYHRYK